MAGVYLELAGPCEGQLHKQTNFVSSLLQSLVLYQDALLSILPSFSIAIVRPKGIYKACIKMFSYKQRPAQIMKTS